jgi:hypothetical protein
MRKYYTGVAVPPILQENAIPRNNPTPNGFAAFFPITGSNKSIRVIAFGS